MYKMELKKEEKVFLITMSGLIIEKDNTNYIEELKKNIRSINSMEYNIVIDARELRAIPQKLIGHIELITSILFKKRYSIMPKYAVAFLQVDKAVKENKNDKFNDSIIVESYEEVLKSIA